MKRLISAALALTLIGTTAASAQSYRNYAPAQSYNHNNNNGAALALGLFALGGLAIIAGQNSHNLAPVYNPPCNTNNRYSSYYNNGRNGYGNQCNSRYSTYGNQNYNSSYGQYNRNDDYGRSSSYYGSQNTRNDRDADDYGYNRGGW